MNFEQARIDVFHLKRDGSEDAQHAQSADHGVEQVAVLLRRACDFCSGGQQGGELDHMFADGTHSEIVLAMNVDTEAAPRVVVIVPETTGGHQPVGQDMLPYLPEV